MAKRKNTGIVLVMKMSASHVQHRQDMLRSSAASPQASKRDLLARRNGKVGKAWKKEVW